MKDRLIQYYKWWRLWGTFPIKLWVDGAKYYRQKDFVTAERYYCDGLNKFPSHLAAPSALLDYAHCLFKNGKLSESQDALRQAIAKKPRLRDGYIRLARIQLWSGQLLDAAWTIRRALQFLPVDPEMVALFITALVENGGPKHLLREAQQALDLLLPSEEQHPLLELALIRLELHNDGSAMGSAYKRLEDLALGDMPTFDVVVAYSEALLRRRRTLEARDQLRKALRTVPSHPRVLSLLAESYLLDCNCSNSEYAVQLASQACQSACWLSAREMHILAAAYQRKGDKIAALLTASKAREEGSRLLGAYSELKVLDQLISDLSSGTLGGCGTA